MPSAILSPAVIAAQTCPTSPVGPHRIEPADLAAAFDGHLPHTLPLGFGLLAAWRPHPGQAAAVWADTRCRTVELDLVAREPAGAAGPRVGPWVITRSDAACGNGLFTDVLCLAYEAPAGGRILVLQTVALAREDADAIALSIQV